MVFDGILLAAVLGIYGYLFKIERRLTRLETINEWAKKLFSQNSANLKG